MAVWSYLDLAGSPRAAAEFFAFAQGHRIDTLYLGAAGLLPGQGEPLAAFLQEAQHRGLRVSLVLGRDAWTRPEHHGEALAEVRAIGTFARSMRAAGRVAPVSLQLDVEPHALPDWGRNQVRLAGDYLDLVAAARAELQGGLPLDLAIPVWWDQVVLRRQGRKGSLSEWAMGQADVTVLMDYRNQAEGILAGAADGLRLAEGLHRQVVVGLAVHRNREAETARTSFGRKGQGALYRAMDEVDRRLKGRPGYGGFAVFTYEDWCRVGW